MANANFGIGDNSSVGHANDAIILLETGDSLYIGSSAMVFDGMPVVKYNKADKSASIVGNIDITDGNKSIPIWGSQFDYDNVNMIVSASGGYRILTPDLSESALNSNQTVVSEKYSNFFNDKKSVLGGLSNILTVGQADWVTDKYFYSISTTSGYADVMSVITEHYTGNETNPTGRYWLVQDARLRHNEMEKCWIENGNMFANVNVGDGNKEMNIIVNLGKV